MSKSKSCWTALVTASAIALAAAAPSLAAEKSAQKLAPRAVGSTSTRPPVALDSDAMNAMLRADRDKDGTLSREELERYDMGLGRRFKEADADRDGKLTLYEFEKLLTPPEAVGATR